MNASTVAQISRPRGHTLQALSAEHFFEPSRAVRSDVSKIAAFTENRANRSALLQVA
jgi:hypothetical protein